MTEEEAKIFAERLRRIWVPHMSRIGHKDNGYWHTFYLSIRGNDLSVRFCSYQNFYATFSYGMARAEGGTKMCACFVTGQILFHDADGRGAHFHDQYLEVFRRGCWLSGAPVEASAHEKAEWIRSFSHEEVEAWNLTF